MILDCHGIVPGVKLLMVARRFPPDVKSGTETVFGNLYERARVHHDVRLVTGWIRDRKLIPAEALGVDLRDKRFGLSHALIARAAGSEARRFRPDVVLSNTIEVPLFAAPTAIVVHDLNFGRADRHAGDVLRRALYRWRCTRARVIVSPSRATRDALVQLGVDPDRIEVIHNGVDLERFRPPDPGEVPPHDGIVILCPGRILAGKGQHVAIDAVARLSAAEKSRVRLVIAGAVADPVYLGQLKVHARGQPVTFATDVDDLAPYYRACDLVVFPTLMREGFGYAAVEGMASAQPVVWTDQAATREATGGIGFPVPPDDPLALRAIIRRRLEDPAPFQLAGAEGRAFVLRWYGWDRVWAGYQRVLGRLVS